MALECREPVQFHCQREATRFQGLAMLDLAKANVARIRTGCGRALKSVRLAAFTADHKVAAEAVCLVEGIDGKVAATFVDDNRLVIVDHEDGRDGRMGALRRSARGLLTHKALFPFCDPPFPPGASPVQRKRGRLRPSTSNEQSITAPEGATQTTPQNGIKA